MQYKTYHFKSLTSTQDKAKEFAKKGLSDIVAVADTQTKGRGRFNRKWHSSKDGLWISILLKPENTGNLQYLTFAAAIAVAKSIKKLTKLNTNIKWPNDVHYKGKKLCGILTEGIFGKETYAIVGIGLNANQKSFPKDIKGIATSLRIIINKKVDVNKLMNHIVNEFFNLYNNYYSKNKFKKIARIWKKYSDTINKNIVVITKTRKLEGKAIGIDDECNLLLKPNNKKTIRVVEGDVKVRY